MWFHHSKLRMPPETKMLSKVEIPKITTLTFLSLKIIFVCFFVWISLLGEQLFQSFSPSRKSECWAGLTSKRFISSFIPLEKIVFNPAQPHLDIFGISHHESRTSWPCLHYSNRIRWSPNGVGRKFDQTWSVTSLARPHTPIARLWDNPAIVAALRAHRSFAHHSLTPKFCLPTVLILLHLAGEPSLNVGLNEGGAHGKCVGDAASRDFMRPYLAPSSRPRRPVHRDHDTDPSSVGILAAASSRRYQRVRL